MIRAQELTPEQRAVSQKNYNYFSLVNGASYMCLGETVIILFAVQLSMPNELISAVGAMLYVGFLLLPLGVWRTAKVGAASSQSDFWIMRNIAALLVALSALAAKLSLPLAWGMVLLGAFLFYGFRAAGVIMAQPLVGDVTKGDADRTHLIGTNTAFFYLTGTAAMAIISVLVHWVSSIWMLCGIIVFGALLGVVSSGFMRKIDETEAIRDSARRPLLRQLKRIFAKQLVRHMVAAWFIINLSVIMLIPLAVLTVKKGCGYSDSSAIVFSLVQFASSIVFSFLTGRLSARFGPRRIIVVCYFMLISTAFLWIFAPAGGPMQVAFCVFAFVLLGGTYISSQNAMTHYFLMAVPKVNQVAASMSINVITGVAAGLTGMGIAALLLASAAHLTAGSGDPMALYRCYFTLALLFLAVAGIGVLRLKVVITDFRRNYGRNAVDRTIRNAKRHTL